MSVKVYGGFVQQTCEQCEWQLVSFCAFAGLLICTKVGTKYTLVGRIPIKHHRKSDFCLKCRAVPMAGRPAYYVRERSCSCQDRGSATTSERDSRHSSSLFNPPRTKATI
eukprot:scaffold133_cov169-Amphora_coffeaeformis.AAC.1